MSIKYIFFLIIAIISLGNFGCNSNSSKSSSEKIPTPLKQPVDTSRDHPIEENNFDYPDEVEIGQQIWMTHNLNVDTFLNGDKIFKAANSDEWYKAGANKKPAFCYYNFDASYGFLLGKLYNWYAVSDRRGLAPSGWIIPSEKDWQLSFENYLNDEEGAEKIKYRYGWGTFQEDIPCENCINWNSEYRSKMPCNFCKDTRVTSSKTMSFNGSNTTGFCALPSSQFGRISEFGRLDEAWWWTSTTASSRYAYAFGLEISSETTWSKEAKIIRPLHPVSELKKNEEPKNY